MIDYRPARETDIPAMADLYQRAFPEALAAVFQLPRLPDPAIQDLFAAILQLEPDGFWVADENRRLAGFIGTVVRVKRLYRDLVLKGAVPRMAARWIGGAYRGLSPRFIPIVAKLWWDYRHVEKSLPRQDPRAAQILTLVVDPAYQHQGIGSRLMERAIQLLRQKAVPEARLEVDAAKTGPVRLYQKFGFREIARLPTPRGPALVMTLPLK